MARILVCEDSATQALHLIMLLESEGHEVVHAKDGQEGYNHVQQDAFDLLLSDVQMPKLTGFELCREIRNTLKNTSLPIILMTTLNEMQTLRRNSDVGATAFLIKPFQPDELLRRLEKVLGPTPTVAIDSMATVTPTLSEGSGTISPGQAPSETQQQSNENSATQEGDTLITSVSAASKGSAMTVPSITAGTAPPVPTPAMARPAAVASASSSPLIAMLNTVVTLADQALAECTDTNLSSKLMDIGEAARKARRLAAALQTPG